MSLRYFKLSVTQLKTRHALTVSSSWVTPVPVISGPLRISLVPHPQASLVGLLLHHSLIEWFLGRRLDYRTWHLPQSRGGSAAGGRPGCRSRAPEQPPLSALLSSWAPSLLQPERAPCPSRSVSCETCTQPQSPWRLPCRLCAPCDSPSASATFLVHVLPIPPVLTCGHMLVSRPEAAMSTGAVVQRIKFPWQQISNQELTVKKAEQVVRRWQVGQQPP